MKFGASLIWLTGLTVLWRVHGAPDCAPSSNTLTIKTPQDVADLSTCTAFTGNIVLAADGLSDIVLDGLQTVSGNIEIDNATDLRSLSSTSLTSLSSLTLNNLPLLESLHLPALTNFSSLLWTTLPTLSNCTIATAQISSEIQNITIASTALPSLDWLAWPIGAGLNITTNPNLASFRIPYSTINAGSAITIASNPALQSIDVDALTNIYGGLALSSNNISDLTFPALQNINGFVQLNGVYTNISMPALTQVNGALRVESTESIAPFCADLQAKRLEGHYDCISNATGSSSGSPSPSNGSSTSSTTDTSSISGGTERAAIGGVIGGITLSLLVALSAYWFVRRRTRRQVQEIAPLGGGGKDVEAASLGTVITPRSSRQGTVKELEGEGVAELSAARVVVEMDGGVGKGEEGGGKRDTVRYELPA